MNDHRRLRKIAGGVAALALPLGLAGCSAAGATTGHDHSRPVFGGTVSGTMEIQGGALGHTAPRGVPGTVYLVRKGGDTVKIKTDAHGHFSSGVAVGTYAVSGVTTAVEEELNGNPNDTVPTHCDMPTLHVTVKKGQTSHLTFVCATVP
jgi:hypothetical protein